MGIIQKFKNFLWNELSIRPSTYIVILFAILPIYFCFCWVYEKIINTSGWEYTTGLGYLLYCAWVIPISIAFLFLLLILEYAFGGFRISFDFLKNNIIKIIILFFYSLSLFCLYFIPSILFAIGYNLISI